MEKVRQRRAKLTYDSQQGGLSAAFSSSQNSVRTPSEAGIMSLHRLLMQSCLKQLFPDLNTRFLYSAFIHLRAYLTERTATKMLLCCLKAATKFEGPIYIPRFQIFISL